MNVGSLFSGVGGMDYGLARAGFTHAFFCEGGGDPDGTREERQQWAQGAWRRTVLAHHWPGVPIYEDVRLVGAGSRREELSAGAPDFLGRPPREAVRDVADPNATRRSGGRDERSGDGRDASGRNAHAGRAIRHVDLLCGGFPCQDLSVAGQRRGLAGARSGLFFEFARIIDALRPRWVLLENVPGLLSSNGGRDFGIVVGTLADLGYGVGWRVLDSRFFGVPQRRRRVFIVGAVSNGDPRAAAVRAGQVLAVGSRCPRHPATRGEAGAGVAGALTGRSPSRLDDACVGGGQLVAAPLSHGSNPNSNMAGRRREDDENLVELGWNWQTGGDFRPMFGEQAPALQKNQTTAVGVRRLTPRECERLQALPDDWTAHGPDSRRYAALGDAVTASVAEWIGRRIARAAA